MSSLLSSSLEKISQTFSYNLRFRRNLHQLQSYQDRLSTKEQHHSRGHRASLVYGPNISKTGSERICPTTVDLSVEAEKFVHQKRIGEDIFHALKNFAGSDLKKVGLPRHLSDQSQIGMYFESVSVRAISCSTSFIALYNFAPSVKPSERQDISAASLLNSFADTDPN